MISRTRRGRIGHWGLIAKVSDVEDMGIEGQIPPPGVRREKGRTGDATETV